MYQFHSTVFLPWQHYYHQQLNVPLFLKDQKLKTSGMPVVSNKRIEQKWVSLWKKALADIDKTTDNKLIITPWVRTRLWKSGDESIPLWRIVSNISGRILQEYTFQIGDKQIRYSEVLPYQICRLVDMLKPTKEDEERLKLITDLNEKTKIGLKTLKTMKLNELQSLEKQSPMPKQEVNESDDSTTETEEESSEGEEDEHDKCLENEEKEKNEMKNEIKELSKKYYDNEQTPFDDSCNSIKTKLNVMEKQVDIIKSIRMLKGHEEDRIPNGATVDSLLFVYNW